MKATLIPYEPDPGYAVCDGLRVQCPRHKKYVKDEFCSHCKMCRMMKPDGVLCLHGLPEDQICQTNPDAVAFNVDIIC